MYLAIISWLENKPLYPGNLAPASLNLKWQESMRGEGLPLTEHSFVCVSFPLLCEKASGGRRNWGNRKCFNLPKKGERIPQQEKPRQCEEVVSF
jgi:hypothetical protein